MFAEQLAAKCFEVVSLPEVTSCLVVERHFGLVRQHEIAVIEQARPMVFSARKVAVFDFVAILIEKLIADQMAGSNLLGKKRVPLIHVQCIKIPLHWPMLCDIHHEFGGSGYAQGSQEDARELPENKNGQRDAN